MDRNRKHVLKTSALAVATGVAMPTIGIAYGMTHGYDGFAVFGIGFIGSIAASLPLAFGVVTAVEDKRTLAAPEGFDTSSFGRMLERLRTISRDGLSAADRIAAQRDVDAGSEHVHHILGKEPWVAVANLESKPASDQMRMRSDTMEEAARLGRFAGAKHGISAEIFRQELAAILPTIVAIVRDFGLEPRGFAPNSRRLPGQDLGTPTAVPLLAAPARTLAAEWLNGDNGSVPMLDRLEADKAATTELDALESAWAQARSTTPPEEVDGVDASFQRGIGRLCATLSETIALRARTDRDVLETNVRYLDVKHPA